MAATLLILTIALPWIGALDPRIEIDAAVGFVG